MNTYPVRCVWIVEVLFPNEEPEIYVFKTRYQAFNLFIRLKLLIDYKYPEHISYQSNISKFKGDAAYGLFDLPISLRLYKKQFTYDTKEIIKERKTKL